MKKIDVKKKKKKGGDHLRKKGGGIIGSCPQVPVNTGKQKNKKSKTGKN
jgi:hypothetical protein